MEAAILRNLRTCFGLAQIEQSIAGMWMDMAHQGHDTQCSMVEAGLRQRAAYRAMDYLRQCIAIMEDCARG